MSVNVYNRTSHIAHRHNYFLDFLKGIGCIGVVFIHIKFPGIFGDFIHRSAQFAVPVFFMISGFYAYEAMGSSFRNTITRRMIKIIRITVYSVGLYMLYRVIHLLKHDALFEGINLSYALKIFLKVIFFSNLDFAGAGHLWFLMTLIEVYIAVLVINKFNLWKWAYMYIPVSFILNGIIYALFMEKWHWRGNIFMSGMAWVMLGHLIAVKIDDLSKIDIKIIFAGILTGWMISLLSLTEKFLFISSLGIILYSASLFILAVREDYSPEKFPSCIIKIGSEYSLYVYIFHIMVSNVYSFILKHTGISESIIVSWTRPIVVCCLSLFLSVMIVKAKK